MLCPEYGVSIIVGSTVHAYCTCTYGMYIMCSTVCTLLLQGVGLASTPCLVIIICCGDYVMRETEFTA